MRVALMATLLAVAGCGGGGTEPGSAPAPSPTVSDPSAAVLVTEDIPRYWAAVDAGGSADDFDRRYLAKGTAGLRDFQARRSLTGAALHDVHAAAHAYFQSIRANSLALGTDSAVANRIRRNYANVKAIYPAAVFPPVTFVIGRFSTGGTIGAAGLLIGAEFYTKAPNSPLHELTAFARNNVRPADSIAIIVAHEHVHTLQARASALMAKPNKTLLDQALMEGSADFLGELVSGGNINAGLQPWALAREDSLWQAFSAAMSGTNVGDWLYNQGTATTDRPGDLGYFIGYRIARAYYLKRGDATAAVREIIEVANANDFLIASGYAPGVSR